jgi:hypothetical protein
MDVFSAGCVVAELFLDGEAVFQLSQVGICDICIYMFFGCMHRHPMFKRKYSS